MGTLRHGFAQYKALTADKELEHFVHDIMLSGDKKSMWRRIAEKIKLLTTAAPCDSTQLGDKKKLQPLQNQSDAATAKTVEDSAAVPKALSAATGTATTETAAVTETASSSLAETAAAAETGSWLSGLAPKKLTKRLRCLIAYVFVSNVQ